MASSNNNSRSAKTQAMKNKYLSEPAKISISICTRERPVMLSNLLKSFETLKPLEGIEVEIDIVENHTEKNLEALLAELSSRIPFKINHHWEPKLGIPVARNHGLRAAKASGATHIIFIDDDETVDSQWLNELWNAYLQYSDDTIILGTVISVFESSENEHLQHLLQRKIRPTGYVLDTCATNNVIVHIDTLDQHQLLFDESRPLAGGTDSKLFRKAHLLKIPMFYCAEAIVYEDIPADRINMRWISKRNFRVGLTYGEYHRENSSGLAFPFDRLRALLKHSFKTIIHTIAYNPEKLRHRWIKVCLASGQIMGYFNVRIDSYKNVNGG
jgi:succinoglycan biosynthesis protein ExoM